MREVVKKDLGEEYLYEIKTPSMGGDDFAYFEEVIYRFTVNLEHYGYVSGDPKWDFIITEKNRLIQELSADDMKRLSIQPPGHSEGLFGRSVARKGSPRGCYRSALYYSINASWKEVEPFELEYKFKS